jgi:hypothetical protein
LATNAFTLSTPSLTPVGVAISPEVAMFNHSCAPNAVVVFPEGCGEEGGMKVVLIEDVAPGQEVRFQKDTRGGANEKNRYLRPISTSRFHGTSDVKS